MIPFNSRAEEVGNGTLVFPDKTATSSVEKPKVEKKNQTVSRKLILELSMCGNFHHPF